MSTSPLAERTGGAVAVDAPTVVTALSGRLASGAAITAGIIEYGSLFVGWAVLVALAAVVLVIVGVIARAQGRRDDPAPPAPAGRVRPTPAEVMRMRADAEALGRHAVAAVAAAQRAHARAAQAQARCTAAQQAREAAIQRHEAAYRAYETARLKLAESGTPPAVPDPPAGARADGEDGDGHQLERAALAAYRGGFLSVDELTEIWRRASGWSPQQEQREHEMARLRADERDARRGVHAATAAERLAGKEAGVAEVAARAMADEASEAIEEARLAREAAEAWARHFARRGARWRGVRPRRG
jgi:hypothetical protein